MPGATARPTRDPAAEGLPAAALTGPVGEWVRAATPHTEVDPAALLISTMVACGVVAGRRPHLWAGNARQPAAIFAVVVADTPKANRGLSWAVTRRLLGVIDPELLHRQVRTGLGNGRPVLETLHAAALPDRHSPGDRPRDSTRLLVHDPSFTRTLGMAARPNSEVATLVRSAWDGHPLEVGHGRHRVEQHHLGVIAHATRDQLAHRLSITDASASFVNRFAFVIARRQPPLVDEGNVPPELMVEHGRRLREGLQAAARLGVLCRSPDAEEVWKAAYPTLAGDDPGGLLGIMVARAARHAMRFALVHALTEGAAVIGAEHIEAALALWSYCRRSAATVASSAPSASADLGSDLLAAVLAAGERGLSLSEQLDHFGRNVPAGRVRVARQALEEAGLVVSGAERRAASGRPAMVTRAVQVAGGGRQAS